MCVLRTWVWLHDALYVSEHVLRGHFNLVQLSTQTLKFRVILRDTLSLTRFLCHKLKREREKVNIIGYKRGRGCWVHFFHLSSTSEIRCCKFLDFVEVDLDGLAIRSRLRDGFRGRGRVA